MNRILLLIICTAFLFQSQAQNVNSNAFQGSLLCNERVIRVTQIPDTFKTFAFIKKEIKSFISPNNIINVHYFFGKFSGQGLVSDTTVLNSYFPLTKPGGSYFPNPHWALKEYYYIDYKLVDSTSSYGSPYGECYTFKPTKCDELTVYRHSLQQVCPSFETKIVARSYHLQDNNLEVTFIDTLINQSFVCKALGWRQKVDSVVASGLWIKAGLAIHVSFKSINKVLMACVNSPCPEFTQSQGYIGKITPRSLCFVTHAATHESEYSIDRLYPNPATGSINVPESVSSITITDIKGKKHILEGSGSVSLNDIEPGIYAVTYHIDGKQINTRLVVY